MVNVYSFDGILIFSLLLICTCAYLKRIPKLRQWMFSEKKGFLGIFYKAAVIGTRLHIPVCLTCIATSLYLILLK